MKAIREKLGAAAFILILAAGMSFQNICSQGALSDNGVDRAISDFYGTVRVSREIEQTCKEVERLGGDASIGIWIYEATVRHPELSAKDLIGIINKESGLKINAISESGAQGLGQIMPSTARLYTPLLGWENFDPFNGQQNVFMTAFILDAHFASYGRGPEAYVVYHGGPKALRHYAGGQFHKIPKTYRYAMNLAGQM